MKTIDFAALMHRHLPEVWRDRDNARLSDSGAFEPGDLQRLLMVYGETLDALYRTLRQRYYDGFPDFDGRGPDDEGLRPGCQPWVLPYLAQLLDVVPISPLDSGRRAEVSEAIAWRQRKGTPDVAERIAEQVAGLEAELFEGWRRVAVAVRPGFAALPAASFGEAELRLAGSAPDASAWLGPARARHAGLPNGSVDLRFASRAMRNDGSDPTVQTTRYPHIELSPALPPEEAEAERLRVRTEGLRWRQANRHGVPCFPGSYQDPSVRTVDLRQPDWRRGHAHPRRVVLHAAPFEGFCPPYATAAAWAGVDSVLQLAPLLPAALPLQLLSADGVVSLRPLSPSQRVWVTGDIVLAGARNWRFEDLDLDGMPEAPAGHVELLRCQRRDLLGDDFAGSARQVPWADIAAAVQALPALTAGHPVELLLQGDAVTLRRRRPEVPARLTGQAHLTLNRAWRFEDLWLDGELKVSAGRVSLERCAVRRAHTHPIDIRRAVLAARSCLFGELLVPRSRADLEYVTVLGRSVSEVLYASDCIFMQFPRKDLIDLPPDVPEAGCIRYSRLPTLTDMPAWMADGVVSELRVALATCSAATPVFAADDFGRPGSGVLHPASVAALRFGAEDGGEMGAFHELRHTLREQAVLDKLAGYLPLGIEAVLAPDDTLACAPPASR
ncbi:MAG: hypothetical protein KF788_18020 [Piscinibacter sp.]|nr:hypothetical protein [Piscinibacter sp.]